MNAVSSFAVPTIIVIVLLAALARGVNVFDTFIQGAKSGIAVSLRILPSLVALITAVGIFRASGALDVLCYALAPAANFLGLPSGTIPLALLRPVSGSGALVIFRDILATYGPDSLVGRVASVMEGSTETTFYTIAVYYGAVSVNRTRHTLPSALTGDIVGFVMSAAAVKLFFGA
jgi:spore maturation protein B